WLAGELLEYHRREARPGWWWFFARLNEMSPAELVDDSEAIGRLAPDGTGRIRVKQSLEWRLRFPAQQDKLAPGDTPFDPGTKAPAGTIREIDDTRGVLVVRRGPKLADVPLPAALVPPGPLQTREQQAALGRLASSVLHGDACYTALED